jgi:hypothetical protein
MCQLLSWLRRRLQESVSQFWDHGRRALGGLLGSEGPSSLVRNRKDGSQSGTPARRLDAMMADAATREGKSERVCERRRETPEQRKVKQAERIMKPRQNTKICV